MRVALTPDRATENEEESHEGAGAAWCVRHRGGGTARAAAGTGRGGRRGHRHRHLRLGLPRLLRGERAPPSRPGDGPRDGRPDRRARPGSNRPRTRPAGHHQPGDGLRNLRGLSRWSAAMVQPSRGAGRRPGDSGGVRRPGRRPGEERGGPAGEHAGRARGTGGAARRGLPRRTSGWGDRRRPLAGHRRWPDRAGVPAGGPAARYHQPGRVRRQRVAPGPVRQARRRR